MSINKYLFQGSNIGPNGILNDGQNIPEMLTAIQKKYLGQANIVIDTPYFTANYGGNIINNTPNAFQYIHQSKIFGQIVPLLNPLFPSITFENSINIPSWSNYEYFAFNTQMSNDFNSIKYTSLQYPYIAYYQNLLLTCIGYDNNKGLYSNLDTTYTHPLLQGAISGSYDITYSPILLGINKDTGNPYQIVQDDGSWILDTDAGVLTFYDLNDSTTSLTQVSRSNAPTISFYRYEGLYGEANILNGQDL